MSIEVQPPPLLALPSETLWRFSVAQYHSMIRAGILTDDDPVELLEGWIVTKMPKNPHHRIATQLTREALARLVPANWFVDDQEPITMDDSEPEPDVIVVRGARRDYLERHPAPRDLALVVEVSDTTLSRDRTHKRRLYARAGIPFYWLINLIERIVEVYTHPVIEQGDYAQRRDLRAAETIPVIIEDQEVGQVSVSDLLP